MKDARGELGLSQEGLAAAVGGSKRGIQNNEALKSVPGGEVICGLIDLGINANWLLTGEGPMLLTDLQAPSSPTQPSALDPETQTEADLLACFRACSDDGKSALTKIAKALAIPSIKAWFDAGQAMSEAANLFDRKRNKGE